MTFRRTASPRGAFLSNETVRSSIGGALAALAVGLAASLAHAEPETSDAATLDQVIVTATRISRDRDQVPSATTVLDDGQIELRNASSAVELLRQVPGVQIVQPGGGAGIVSVYVRGCQPNYVLFLVDGVEVNDSNDSRGGSFDVSTLAPGELERVEIIRGPQSAIYGADAMCGVVNFITRGRSEHWENTVEATAGLSQSYGTALAIDGPLLEKGGLALRAATADQGSTVPGATFGADNFNAKLVLDRGAGYDVTAHARYVTTHGSDYPDQSGGPEFSVSDARDARSSRQSAFDLGGRLEVASYLSLDALLSAYRHDVDLASPSVLDASGAVDVPARGEISSLARDRGSFDAMIEFPFALRSVVGADYQRERGEVDGYIEVAPGFSLPDSYVLNRHTVGAFGELVYSGIQGASLSGSVRHDSPSDTESHTTVKAGIVASPDRGVTEFRADWGQGFKEPSLWALGNALVGNQNLKSEQSRTTELGVSRYFDDRRSSVELTVFDNRFIDLIDFDNASFQFVNRPLVTGQGAELAVSYALSGTLQLMTQTSYVDVDPKDSGIALRQRPKWRGGAQLAWRPVHAWSFYAGYLAVGRQYDFSYPAGGGVTLGSYSVFNVNGEWQANDRLALKLAVDNLFDRHYYEAYGFTVAGVEPRLTVVYRF